MEVRNCPECGKLFNYLRTNLCPECRQKEEEEFQKVRKYLRNNSNVNIISLSENTGVSEDKITKWISEGKIESKTIQGHDIHCQRCGKQISHGRFCEECIAELNQGFGVNPGTNSNSEAGLNQKAEKKKPQFHTKNLRG